MVPVHPFSRLAPVMEGRSSPLAWRPCTGQTKLQLLLLGRDRSGYSRWSDELGIILRELFCLNRALPEFSGVSTFVKTQTLLVLAFAEPNL
ncbi:hypothetical protein L3X38_018287 [Prunus dulcis]|uniref:Uncharacterized protein n=1 Tax=Prunus dulcis TaxID=3755 RepID=A0AAD4W8Q4_PRUDU|nr:hypothetical protein L3X38_018287 [Prunus dulcis]